MFSCAFCRRVPSKIYHAKGIILRSIKTTQPQTTEETPICSICYNKAVVQYNRFREKQIKKRLEQKSISTEMLTSFSTIGSETGSSSVDSIDRLVIQRSQLSIRRDRRKAEEIGKRTPLVSPRRLQFAGSQGRQETGIDMGPPDVPIERRETGSSSVDSIDRLVIQRSQHSIRRDRRKAQEIGKRIPLVSPRRLQFAGSQGRQETGPSDVPIERHVAEVRSDSESIENPIDPVESLSSQTQGRMAVVRERREVAEVRSDSESFENPIDPVESSSSQTQGRMAVVRERTEVAEVRTDSESFGNPIDPVESSPQTQERMVVVREYESDEEVEIHREGDHLPGVQPHIRKRRTQVVFTDERLIPVYNNKSYGG